MTTLDDVRRDRAMEAAVATFARYGYRRTTMDALAQAADMSRPALYQYFTNKEAIFREMTRWALDRSAGTAEAAADAAATPGSAIEVLLEALLALHDPDFGTSHFYELLDEVQVRAGDMWAAYEKRILDAIRGRLVADRATRIGADVHDAAIVLFYGAKGISLEPHAPELRRQHLRLFVAAFLRGLSAKDL